MSIVQFLRIVWAYRLFVIITAVATTIGAVIAILIVPPSYTAKTRVMLNTLKPDPVTGEVLGGRSGQVFVATQQQLITDTGVAGQAVEALGWLSNPDLIAQYTAAKVNDRDMRSWLSQRITDRTKVIALPGTNILEISFRAGSAGEASSMANALRDAYVESTLITRRKDANRNAAWYAQQAENERVLLDAANVTKTAFERANNIVMQDENVDIETARLRALASQSPVANVSAPAVAMPGSSSAALQLAQLDAQIAQSARTLGANHPSMIEMKARRAGLAQVANQERAAQASAASAAAGSGRVDLNRAVSDQTARVIANRDKIAKLTQLQQDVNLHQSLMAKAQARSAELRQEGAVADAGITVLSEAFPPKSPSFPNKPLILGGGFGLGAGIGLLLSLLAELLRRRVRGVEDLQNAFDIPVLAVITPYGERRPKGGSARAIIHRLTPRWFKPAIA